MPRIVHPGVILLSFLLFAAGCGNSGKSDTSTEKSSPAPAATGQTDATGQAATAETPGRPMIPPERPDVVEGLYIEPRFDAGGDVSTLAVAPGELFNVYVCARHPDYDVSTAQWKLDVPDGVEVIGEAKMFDEALSLGSWTNFYITTFPCQTGSQEFAIVKYNCIAKPGCSGGEFRTVKAVPTSGQDPSFLGFVTCGDHPEQVPASGGSATLNMK